MNCYLDYWKNNQWKLNTNSTICIKGNSFGNVVRRQAVIRIIVLREYEYVFEFYITSQHQKDPCSWKVTLRWAKINYSSQSVAWLLIPWWRRQPGYQQLYQWPILLTWFNFNPSVNKQLYLLWDEITYPFPNFNGCHTLYRTWGD